MLSLKCVPRDFFSFANALRDLMRRSSRPGLIPPDGVTRKPRYLYSLTHARFLCLKLNLYVMYEDDK